MPNAPVHRFSTYFHIHLVSDSTGETLNAVAKAVVARFDHVVPIEHVYALVRSRPRIEQILDDIAAAPGVVLHTIVERDIREALETGCRSFGVPAFAVLDPLVAALSHYLGASLSNRVGAQHALDTEYFSRIEALNYAMAHDDGQGIERLSEADVILVGVSRTSKTPTSIYLAHRGVRSANVPLVPGRDPPPFLGDLKYPLIVGLTASPDRLVQIRKNRLLSLSEDRDSDYVDADAVRDETIRARRLFERNGWPVIDVTRRSIEETAATVINLLNERRAGRLTRKAP